MTDLSALKAVVDLRRKNIPNAREFDRRLNLIAESVLPLGEDGPSPYGTLKTRTPEVMQILQDARSAVLSGVGTYSAGRFQYQDSLAIEDMSIPMGDKPSMKFFYPPTFAGSAMEALKGASSYQEIIDFLRNNDFYVLDLETTGLPDLDDRDIKNDPIQVAVTKVSGLQVVDQFSTYINPESKISSYTLKGVGDGRGGKVTPEFLEGFPTKREAMEQLIEFMPRGSILVGHNALMFDLEVVERTLSEAGLGSLEPSGVMDTLGLARYIMPEWSPATPDAPFKVNAYGKQNKSFSLEALVTYFGLSNNGRHEADADVASTVEVLQKMLDRAQRGLAVSGPEFDFNAATNGWTQEAYDAAKEAYKEQSAAYMISRSLDILSMEGYTPEMAQQTLQDVVNSLNGIADGAQSENRTPINIPAANTLRDLYPGSYVFDVNDGRVGFSLGIINGNVMTDMPSPEVLASGRFVLEQLPPSRLARVTDRFMSKNGVLLDYGMEVSSPSIPVVGTAYVRSLTGGNDNVIVRVNNNLIPINARDLAAVPVKGDSAATQEQESMIVNLLEDLVSSKIMDRATANGFQKAADGHFYTADVANKIITRLSNAAQQKRQLDANSDISVPAGENAAPRAQVESIEDMATRKPKDKKTAADLDIKAIEPLLDKLPKKPTREGENIIAAIVQGLNVVVKALAGSGKTTSLRNSATALKIIKPLARILYVVFNKENQLEAAESMPSNTEARTSDSISFRAPVNKTMREKFEKLPTHPFHTISTNTDRKYIKDQNTRDGLIEVPAFSTDFGGPRAPINPKQHTDLADAFDVKAVKFAGNITIPALTLARVAYETMTNFVLSADATISAKHIKKAEMGPIAPSNEKDELAIISLAQKMWDNILSAYNPQVRQLLVDQTHMFKNWALTRPNLREEDGKGGSIHGFSHIPDVLFLDEAQDINPAFLGVIFDQINLHKNGLQIVAVGDTNQRIFGFRGTADLLGVLARDITLSLTKSFRTGDGILKIANQVLGILGEKLRLVGRDGDGSKIVETGSMTDPDLVITRTNTGIVEAGVWSEILHPGQRVATTAAYKDRLTLLIKTLSWITRKDGPTPETRPKQISNDLISFKSYDDILKSADEGDPYMSMIIRMIGATKRQLAKRAGGGAVSAFKTYEALKELDRIVGNFRILSDLFEVPSSVGKSGELGGNISYEIVNDRIILSNTRYMKHKRFGQGVWDNKGAIEDSGFKRVGETGGDGNSLMMWSAPAEKDVKKQLAELVKKLRGEDAIMRIMTDHTVKGLEAKKVKLWEDWKKPEDLSASEMRLYYVAITRAMDELDLGGLEWITSVGQDVDLIEDMSIPNAGTPSNPNYVATHRAAIAKEEKLLAEYRRDLGLPEYQRVDRIGTSALEDEIARSASRLQNLKQNPDVLEENDKRLLEDLVGIQEKLKPVVDAGSGDVSILEPFELQLANRYSDKNVPAAANPVVLNRARLKGVESLIENLDNKINSRDIEEMATPAADASPEMKAKLYEIVKEAADFYSNRMLNFNDATEAVKYFRGRGFSKQDAEKFQLGYAPKTWATLYQHLLKKGFTEEEMLASGLIKRSERNGRMFDALRDRIVFPIREADGRVVGFTGRAVDPNEDIRYMLTSNTPIYQKSEVLFGLDQAKNKIAETGEMVVVEGQFDALAMHAAGIDNAVATSGTTFGPGHVRLFEDLAGDKKKSIIFSFDPDMAGTKAAESVYDMLKGSDIDLYAVSGESDLDPAEIYSKDNEEGLKTLIDNKMPMLEYLIERIIATGNISSIEGRIAAIRAITKLLSGVEDQGVVNSLISKYAARLDTTEESMIEAIAQNL
jgi:DNA primase catalytic core